MPLRLSGVGTPSTVLSPAEHTAVTTSSSGIMRDLRGSTRRTCCDVAPFRCRGRGRRLRGLRLGATVTVTSVSCNRGTADLPTEAALRRLRGGPRA